MLGWNAWPPDRAIVGQRWRYMWLMLGDIGYLDDDGFLFLCGRANDMIIGGAQHYWWRSRPYRCECRACRSRGLGIPDEEYGECVCAMVQPQPGAALSAAGVLSLTGKIAGYKTAAARRISTRRARIPRQHLQAQASAAVLE